MEISFAMFFRFYNHIKYIYIFVNASEKLDSSITTEWRIEQLKESQGKNWNIAKVESKALCPLLC